MSKPRLLSTLLLLFAMLFAQYSASVHASEHMFHEHEEACEIYLNVERFADALISVADIALFNHQGLLFDVVALNHVCECDKPLPQSRAPPVLLS